MVAILFLFLFAKGPHPVNAGSHGGVDTIKQLVKRQFTKPDTWPKPKQALPKDKRYYNDCVFTHQFTPAERLKQYPFSRAAKIVAVSYQNGVVPNPNIRLQGDTTTIAIKRKRHGLFVRRGRLDTSSLFELKSFNKSQINRLSNLMFNTGTKVQYDHAIYGNPASKCFEPRNAILFVDKNGIIYDYIEMSFQCKGTSSKSGRILLSCGCNQELDIAKKLLIDIGIKFGTTTIDDSAFQELVVK